MGGLLQRPKPEIVAKGRGAGRSGESAEAQAAKAVDEARNEQLDNAA